MIIERGEDPGPFPQPRAYVTHLRELFRRRCAYCLTPDDKLGGEEAMKVDHFIPQSRDSELILAWSNLYYCCDVCNNRKSNFPNDNELAAGERFVDPCVEDPDEHFRLVYEPKTGDFCKVVGLSRPAKYEVRRLQFNRRRFLQDFWRELNHGERRWNTRREIVLGLQSKLDRLDPDNDFLLAECEQELAAIRDRWPFPREGH